MIHQNNSDDSFNELLIEFDSALKISLNHATVDVENYLDENVSYYSIYDFYLASGSLGAKYENGNWDVPLNIDFYEKENKIFELSTYNKIVADTLITATLSTGQILDFVISKDSFNNYNNYPPIDLTNYEYESIKFTIKVLVNPYYGMGDYIIETGIDIVGDNFIEVILEYEFN